MINLYKRLGETPLQAVERYREGRAELENVPMTYAGRLDPMAEGVLIVLSGEETKDREKYLALPKEYEFEFVFGISTDTHDILGIIDGADDEFREPERLAVGDALKSYIGSFDQAYPPYSSKVVNGVPLFSLARQGKLKGKVLPTHKVTVRDAMLLQGRLMNQSEFKEKIFSNIALVNGDFRQKEIEKRWKKYFDSDSREDFFVWKAKISCDSGFYVRRLVHDIGGKLMVKAMTVSILRTKVGDHLIEDSKR